MPPSSAPTLCRGGGRSADRSILFPAPPPLPPDFPFGAGRKENGTPTTFQAHCRVVVPRVPPRLRAPPIKPVNGRRPPPASPLPAENPALPAPCGAASPSSGRQRRRGAGRRARLRTRPGGPLRHRVPPSTVPSPTPRTARQGRCGRHPGGVGRGDPRRAGGVGAHPGRRGPRFHRGRPSAKVLGEGPPLAARFPRAAPKAAGDLPAPAHRLHGLDVRVPRRSERAVPLFVTGPLGGRRIRSRPPPRPPRAGS